MDTLDLSDFLRFLVRRWRIIVTLGLLGTAVGAFVTTATTPQYRATSTLFVSLQDRGDTVMLNQGNTFAQARVRSYAEVVTSPHVTEPVAETLGLDMTPSQLARKITTEVPLETVLLKITVTDTQPSRAARISNAIADRFAEVIAEVERPDGARLSPVRLSITQPANSPKAPTSPNLVLNLALGLVAGLTLGTGLAVARESLDTSVRSRNDLTRCLADAGGPAVLGSVVLDQRTSRHPVATDDDAFGRRAEDFRRLRTSLRFVDVDAPPKVIAVSSAVPSEGKTSISINLASALAEFGSSVCLVDADLRRPNVAHALGLVKDAGLTTVMIGQANAEDVMQSVGSFSVLASGVVPPNPAEMLGSAQFRTVVRSLADRFDHVVIDTAPVLPVADTPAMASAVDGYLLVARYAKSTRGQLTDAVRALQDVGTTVLGSVLNMVPAKRDSEQYGYGYTYRPRIAGRRGWLRSRRRLRSRGRPATIGVFPAPTAPTRGDTAPAAAKEGGEHH
ncbi:polysaccharide biosynthesis tyrosine autokinase [Streptomyces sp. TRM68367]|uniref:polysaccharide biosynthesis tyrosine autokinase n=1 Tax=Streptomyces sp. TRM68367 TaxID=2758415 RepID=UPI00165A744F|nr:polysaccharide biosynthesis tyrosine autokinase [Streptomyces sp. TRM68367]MBC9726995.1 polysaccharide biosynthesis tyrosine autokinase [Streptomyces sp. TRM68367]